MQLLLKSPSRPPQHYGCHQDGPCDGAYDKVGGARTLGTWVLNDGWLFWGVVHAAVSSCPCSITGAGCFIIAHAVRRADSATRARRTGCEVQGGDGETFPLKAHHRGTTRRTIFHIPQISVIIQQYVSPTAVHQSPLMVKGGGSDVAFQGPDPWDSPSVSAQQVPAEHIVFAAGHPFVSISPTVPLFCPLCV